MIYYILHGTPKKICKWYVEGLVCYSKAANISLVVKTCYVAVEKGTKCTEGCQCVNCQNQVTAVEEREDLVYVAVMDCELEDQ